MTTLQTDIGHQYAESGTTQDSVQLKLDAISAIIAIDNSDDDGEDWCASAKLAAVLKILELDTSFARWIIKESNKRSTQ